MASTVTIRVPALWVVISAAHVAAAAFAWRLLPHGFTWPHPRFWMNGVLPFVFAAAGAACIFGSWKQRAPLAAFPIGMFTGAHVAMAPAWILVFPLTGKHVAVVSGVIAAVLCACAFASLRRPRGWPVAIGAAVGVVLGAFVPWSQRGADPETHPAAGVHALVAGSRPDLPAWAHAFPESEVWSVDAGRVRVALHPLLTFWSRSPDRGWTAFADAEQRNGPPRRYGGGDSYAGEEPGVVRVSAPAEHVLHIDAEAVLPEAVYSHLNTFCALEIRGHHHLFLAFSPVPSEHIEVTYSEYPTGRPERFAFIDRHFELHVVEAESGEKGPFTELAHGPLRADGKLGITVFDDDTPIAQIDFADFARQASTQPSPTAGWGVPENAIEFSLAGARPDSTAAIYMTLAGTSVGRGWDSVGHAAGAYRDRIDVSVLAR